MIFMLYIMIKYIMHTWFMVEDNCIQHQALHFFACTAFSRLKWLNKFFIPIMWMCRTRNDNNHKKFLIWCNIYKELYICIVYEYESCDYDYAFIYFQTNSSGTGKWWQELLVKCELMEEIETSIFLHLLHWWIY